MVLFTDNSFSAWSPLLTVLFPGLVLASWDRLCSYGYSEEKTSCRVSFAAMDNSKSFAWQDVSQFHIHAKFLFTMQLLDEERMDTIRSHDRFLNPACLLVRDWHLFSNHSPLLWIKAVIKIRIIEVTRVCSDSKTRDNFSVHNSIADNSLLGHWVPSETEGGTYNSGSWESPSNLVLEFPSFYRR